jgi:hypothetical protein
MDINSYGEALFLFRGATPLNIKAMEVLQCLSGLYRLLNICASASTMILRLAIYGGGLDRESIFRPCEDGGGQTLNLLGRQLAAYTMRDI